MQSLKQFLAELRAESKKTLIYKKIPQGHNLAYQARIKIDNPTEPDKDIITLLFTFNNVKQAASSDKIGLDAIIVRKGLMDKILDGNYDWYFHFTIDDEINIMGLDHSKQEGASDAVMVIAANLERSFEDFLQEAVPASFVFIGASASQIKLYDAAAKRIIRKHPTYELERKNVLVGVPFKGSRKLIRYGFRRKNVVV